MKNIARAFAFGILLAAVLYGGFVHFFGIDADHALVISTLLASTVASCGLSVITGFARGSVFHAFPVCAALLGFYAHVHHIMQGTLVVDLTVIMVALTIGAHASAFGMDASRPARIAA